MSHNSRRSASKKRGRPCIGRRAKSDRRNAATFAHQSCDNARLILFHTQLLHRQYVFWRKNTPVFRTRQQRLCFVHPSLDINFCVYMQEFVLLRKPMPILFVCNLLLCQFQFLFHFDTRYRRKPPKHPARKWGDHRDWQYRCRQRLPQAVDSVYSCSSSDGGLWLHDHRRDDSGSTGTADACYGWDYLR